MGEAIRLVDVHGAAEHDEAVVTADVGPLIRLAREVDVTNAEAGAPEHRVEDAQWFAGGVLKDEQLAHEWAQIVPGCGYKRYAMTPSQDPELLRRLLRAKDRM